MIAYLSGAMENAENEGSEWRNEITIWLKDNLNHDAFNPVEESKNTSKSYKINNYRSFKNKNPKQYKKFIREIIKQDIQAVTRETDYLIVLWDEAVLKGGGTHGEVTMAYWFNKPIYLVNLLPNKDLSSWIYACSSKIYDSFDSLKLDLLEIYQKS